MLTINSQNELFPLPAEGEADAQSVEVHGQGPRARGTVRLRWSSLSVPCLCLDALPLMQASQNLVVLAREDAGAEKIFRSNGVQLLQRLLDTGEPDLMLAALRTLVGICSEHQSRVGVAEGLATVSVSLSVHPLTCDLSSLTKD